MRAIIVVVAVGAFLGLGSPSSAVTGPSVVAGTAADRALVDRAVDRFEAAGIELPPVEIAFHEPADRARSCHDKGAWYSHAQARIDFCIDHSDPARQELWLLHELGHAVTFTRMTAAETTAFVERNDLRTWNDPGAAAWSQRGAERAADIVAWGLHPDPPLVYWMRNVSCEHLAAEFEILTGAEAPADRC